LAARIVAAANAYVGAMFSAANPTLVSNQAGLHALREGRGSRFDPRVVDLALHQFAATEADACRLEVEISIKQLQPGMLLSRSVESMEGMLILKAGTRLTPDRIESIQRHGQSDPRIGSVFVRCQPDTSDGQPKPESAGPAAREKPSEDKIDLLVVDDSSFLRNALKRELRADGIEVSTTESGWTALEMIEKNHFDAVLVDLLMPAMPGEELVARLKQLVPNVPCIILTGNATRQRVVSLARASNVVAILAKPWNHDQLLAAITAAAAKAPAEEPASAK
jgi:response regulator RpfG family c-di-GMP phosphodiesterase